MKTIYLDNAATTAVAPEVAAVIATCMETDYGNPSSAHHMGITAEKRVRRGRDQVAAALGDPEQSHGRVYFTSGGTESDALGIIGAARANKKRGSHILYSAIEHPAVRESAKMLEREGFTAEAVPVTSMGGTGATGVIDLAALARALRDDTVVVAVMLVNNEIGTIQPVREIVDMVRARCPEAHVHCDAVQALGKMPVDVTALGAHSVALAAHKLHGPKGVGALWLRAGARITPLWTGGGQQDSLRSGTLNVPGIAGMGQAAELAQQDMEEHRVAWREFADILFAGARASGVPVHINGADAPRAPHVFSLRFENTPAEPLLHTLESRGVLVSAGSACSERNRKPSAVLTAIGNKPNDGTIRFSFGRMTRRSDVEEAASILTHAVRDI